MGKRRNNLMDVVIGLVLVGLLFWTASMDGQFGRGEDDIEEGSEEWEVSGRQRRSVDGVGQGDQQTIPEEEPSTQAPSDDPQGPTEREPPYVPAGVTYTRWGRRDCPNEDAELVYSGQAGSSRYNETGGSAEYICLPDHPQYEIYTNHLESTAKIYGVEMRLSAATILDNNNAGTAWALNYADVTCAVCLARGKSSKLMIPGRATCYAGWTMEYTGYLFTGHYGHRAQYKFTCLDRATVAGEKGKWVDPAPGLMYHVQGVCGSLPCPGYVQGRELTCAVCTK